MIPNFIECSNVEEANAVNLEIYTFQEKFSATMGKWIFKKRAGQK